MGRTATFDRDAVVRAARDVFWERGYAATGITDLEEATGLRRSSLYHAFTAKRGLFEAVVQAYLTDARAEWAGLRDPQPAPDALERYVAELAAGFAGASIRARAGCLLLNVASTAVAVEDGALNDLVVQYVGELRAAIRAGVGARRPDLGDVSADDLARVCGALVISALTSARTDADAAARDLAAVPAALRAWDDAPTST
ncbi:TetR/AcrR family transcriptional regulator [Microbacterium sp. 1P10UB]|uniref:TetR/AcrR family transcriptional regulator n=1 Tax=unclassified Microbacterium TaxID=2609290 RepID=UPI0039A1FBED